MPHSSPVQYIITRPPPYNYHIIATDGSGRRDLSRARARCAAGEYCSRVRINRFFFQCLLHNYHNIHIYNNIEYCLKELSRLKIFVFINIGFLLFFFSHFIAVTPRVKSNRRHSALINYNTRNIYIDDSSLPIIISIILYGRKNIR